MACSSGFSDSSKSMKTEHEETVMARSDQMDCKKELDEKVSSSNGAKRRWSPYLMANDRGTDGIACELLRGDDEALHEIAHLNELN